MRQIIRGALLALVAWAPVARAETLADALAFGYESSGLIEQNRATLRAADERVAQAVATLRPVVEWVAGLNETYTSAETAATIISTGGDREFSVGTTISVGLQATLTLFDSGARRLSIDAQKETVLAFREALRNIERQVLFSIVDSYQEVRRRTAFVALRESNVRVISQELQAARDRFEVGEITRTDVALAEAQLASARSQLVAEQGSLAQAVESFRRNVGRLPGNLEPAAPATITQSLDEAQAIALRTDPRLRQLQHQVAVNEINILAGEARQRPTVSLSSELGLSRSAEGVNDLSDASNTARGSLGLNLGGPIYQGGRGASEIRELQANRDASRSELLDTSRAVIENVGNAYASLEVARASRTAFQEQVRAAQAAFEGVREEATLGARTTLDVLEAEQDLLDARTNLAGAEIDEVLASYQVLSAMGLLTVENLGLNVQVYDPSAYYNLVDDAPSRRSEQGRALDRVLESIGAGN